MNDPMIGRTIGKYRIVEHLGRGGMAEVYKAYQPNLDRHVAIKMMHSFLSDEKEFLARFEREAKVVATLRHPNIVQVYDFDADGGVYYMVMEYITGETLKARLQNLESRDEWVSLDDAARIILAVGSALRYAHERNMVHRDVKPANVMITLDGQVILTDFGIAKIVSTSNLTASGAMVGTPSYMAPEQGMGQPGDERSDIYSLGVMLYQLVVGRLPFDADTPLAVVLKHINDPLPLPQALKPDISDDLNRVILKSLAKDPNDRYQKVSELTTGLRQAVGMSPEDSHPDANKSSAIKLAGATMVARVGSGVTPPPRSVTVGALIGAPQEQSGTQVAAPRTLVGGAAASAATTVAAVEKKRPGWLIPAVIMAIVTIIGAGGIAILSAQGGKLPTPTPTLEVPVVVPAQQVLTNTPTVAPLTTQLQQLEKDTELRDKAGSDPSSRIEGLLPAGARFFVKARTADSHWIRIETPDGVTGWIEAEATGLTVEQLEQLPAATTLTRLTDTPTPTAPLTAAPTSTSTPFPTWTAGPTRTPRPVQPPTTAAPPATPTPQAAVEPLGYGFSFQFCTYDGNNYTCNVTVWGTGGDGKYHFALENPDTGNWDEKVGGSANYLMRSRRCRIKVQQLRIWDESGQHLEPNLTMDPNVMPDKFPGGTGCTQ
ncbi:eukaryotic-like serine/threonine-protein kinase [Thermoflexales bacterium]|nr:eukaryotic-like serine/threonine-protein kinase [Thermoflexales bacterium]